MINKRYENYTNEVRNTAFYLIEEYRKNGFVRAGKNGPYNDPETEVRDISHLIVIVALEIDLFGKSQYRDILISLGNYLLKKRDDNGLFIMRCQKGKDIYNGVIGHAWVIEALCYLYKHTNDIKYRTCIEHIISKHVYNEKLHLWYAPGYANNSDEGIDYTLNHQLWYAAALTESNIFLQNDNITTITNDFLTYISSNMWVHRNGLICHPIYRRLELSHRLRKYCSFFIDVAKRKFCMSSYKYREEGYHVFNLMAIARIKHVLHDNEIFYNHKIVAALEYLNKRVFRKSLLNDDFCKDNTIDFSMIKAEHKEINIYGYPYNVTGFEMMYIQQVFKDIVKSDVAEGCLKRQFFETYDFDTRMFGKKSNDETVLQYRVYEYYRYLELVR